MENIPGEQSTSRNEDLFFPGFEDQDRPGRTTFGVLARAVLLEHTRPHEGIYEGIPGRIRTYLGIYLDIPGHIWQC